MTEYTSTKPMAMAAPIFCSSVSTLPVTAAMYTITMTRFAVFATYDVTAPVALIVIVASSLYR